jgi:hypothetical protein
VIIFICNPCSLDDMETWVLVKKNPTEVHWNSSLNLAQYTLSLLLGHFGFNFLVCSLHTI